MRRNRASSLLLLAAALCASSGSALLLGRAEAATPGVTVGVGGAAAASATYSGGPVAGNADPLGPPAPACTAGQCDQTAVVLKAPAGYVDAHVITLTVKLGVSDPTGQNTLDIGILDASGAVVGSATGVADGGSAAASNLQPGTYTVEVDGDIALTPQSYTATVTASAAPKVAQQTAATTGMTFSRETIANPYVLGTEPNLALDPNGKDVWSSPIFGTSTTISFILRSQDGGQTFKELSNIVPGTSAGKVDHCTGGGDSDFATDDYSGDLYQVDLGQTEVPARVTSNYGQTFSSNCLPNDVNQSAAVGPVGTTFFPDRQWLSFDRKHQRIWFIYRDGLLAPPSPGAVGGVDVAKQAYGEYIRYSPLAAGPGQAADAQVQFSSLCTQAGSATPCFSDGSIAGNTVSDNNPASPHYGNTYLAVQRTGTAAGVGLAIINPDNTANPVTESTIPGSKTQQLFPTVAVDQAGNVYESWVDDVTYQIHIARSADGGKTWGPIQTINAAPAATTIMPWVVAGSDGRVAVAYYGSPLPTNPTGNYGPWFGYVAVSMDASSANPHWTQSRFTDRPNHIDPICLSGLGCTADTSPSGDRELGDFFKIALGGDGRLLFSIADGDNQLSDGPTGSSPTPSFAHIVRQVAGPSLLASVGTVKTLPLLTDASTVAKHVTPVPVQDATGAPGADNQALSIIGAALTYGKDGKLHATIQPGAGGFTQATTPPALPTATYWLRWLYKDHVYWAGAETTGGQSLTFEGGEPGLVDDGLSKKFATYPDTFTPSDGSFDNGVIRFTVDPADVGSPKVGDELFAVTGYVSSHLSPTLPAATNTTDLPVIDDSLPPFNTASATGALPKVLPPGVTKSVHAKKTTKTPTKKATRPGGSLAATGGDVSGLLLYAVALMCVLGAVRLRRRRL